MSVNDTVKKERKGVIKSHTKRMSFFSNKKSPYKVCRFIKKQKDNINNSEILNSETNNTKVKSKKSKKWTWIFFILNISILAIVLTFSLIGENIQSVLAPDINWKYMAVVIIITLALIGVDTLKNYILIYATTKTSRPFLAYKSYALSKYYDAVTPMSAGGEPYQIYYMNKRGVKGDAAASIPLMQYVIWQILYAIVSTTLLIYNSIEKVIITNSVVTLAAWITVIINVVWLGVIILLSTSKRVAPRLVIGCLKFLAKLKIIKNYQKTFRSVMRFVVNYQKTIKMLVKNVFVILSEFVLAILTLFLSNILMYFIYRAFLPVGMLPMNWFEVFLLSMICNLAIFIIPTPGAAGGAEGFFALVFNNEFGENGLFWPIIVWRIATYYFYIVQGLIVLVYDFAIGNKKAEKLYGNKTSAKDKMAQFRQTLQENREIIEIVQEQEEDKIPASFIPQKIFTPSTDVELIKDSDLVPPEEMRQKVSPAEQVLTEVRIKDIERRKKKRAKNMLKKNKDNSK